MASVTITGDEELQRELRALHDLAPLRDAMDRAAALVQGHISSYTRVAPPERPSYQRGYGRRNRAGKVTRYTSEKLNQSWSRRVEERAGAIEGIIGAAASYGPYVMDRNRQAWMHRGRWMTDEAVLEANRSGIEAILGAALQRTGGTP